MDNVRQMLWETLRRRFNILHDKENEQSIIADIKDGVSFRGVTLWILIFAILIASLGLNVDSTAVIIGAMLISPLMGPIIGMGYSIGVNDWDLFKRSLKNYGLATLISVITSTIYFLLTPFNEAQSELLARISPTLYDVLIAFFGGAAGIIAMCTKGKGNVIPGVAIATALMPPLCTAGYGLAQGNMRFFLGAFYLFFINTVFICLATFIGVRMMKFKHIHAVDPARQRRVSRQIIVLVIITLVPAAFMTVSILRRSIESSNLNNFIRKEMNMSGSTIIQQEMDRGRKTINVVVVGKTIPKTKIDSLNGLLKNYRLGDYRLAVVQGSQSDSLMARMLSERKQIESEAMSAQYQKQNELAEQLGKYTRYEETTKSVMKEMSVLFPQIKTLSIYPAHQARKDTTATEQYVVAMAGLSQGVRLKDTDRNTLTKWLKSRIGTDSLRLVTVVAP